MRSKRLAVVALLIIALAVIQVACSDDGTKEDGTATATPTVQTPGAEEPTPAASPTISADSELPDSIGTATMSEDGTITLTLTATSPDGITGEGVLEYPPDDPDYQMIYDHIGGIEPGQEKPVAPFE